MDGNRSVEFFDRQFLRQIGQQDFALNPFEQAVLPFLKGEVLDLGCGLGNLAMAAARQGCYVTAIDASSTAISHLERRAARNNLPITVVEADLRNVAVGGQFDCAVSIGLLMFFPPDAAREGLRRIQQLVVPGGLAAVNTLIEGTTYMEMFEPGGYCLFHENELAEAFSGWKTEYLKFENFPAPVNTVKRFCTMFARRPMP